LGNFGPVPEIPGLKKQSGSRDPGIPGLQYIQLAYNEHHKVKEIARNYKSALVYGKTFDV